MRTLIGFRAYEKHVRDLLEPGDFKRVDEELIDVWLDEGDPKLSRISARSRSPRFWVEPLFTAWWLKHEYSPGELDGDEWYQASFDRHFQPDCSEAGTKYDWECRCKRCGVGRKQLSLLQARYPRINQGASFASTYTGGEYLVSKETSRKLLDSDLKGIYLLPVLPSRKASKDLDQALLAEAESQLAATGAIEADFEWRSFVDGWLTQRGTDPAWCQLCVVNPSAELEWKGSLGIDFTNSDPLGIHRCWNKGHKLGLNQIGLLNLRHRSLDDRDLQFASAFVGGNGQYDRPLVCSGKFRQMVIENGWNGFTFDKVQLI